MLTARQRSTSRRLHRVLPEYRFRIQSVPARRIEAEDGHHYDAVGLCVETMAGHRVLIDRALPAMSWTDAALHEAAHVVADTDTPDASDREPHGASWGKAFAMVYRRFFGER